MDNDTCSLCFSTLTVTISDAKLGWMCICKWKFIYLFLDLASVKCVASTRRRIYTLTWLPCGCCVLHDITTVIIIIFFYFMNTCWVPHLEMSPKHFTMTTIMQSSLRLHSSHVWLSVASHIAFWIFTEVVTTLFGCYMAGTTWNCCRLGASSVYNIQPYTSLQCPSSEATCMGCACGLSVTCHLYVWQNGFDLLRATSLTRGRNGYRNKSQHRKLTVEKKIIPPLQQGFEPATFRTQVRRSDHWAIPAPVNDM